MSTEHTFIAILFLLIGVVGVGTFRQSSDGNPGILETIYAIVAIISACFVGYSICVGIYLAGQP